MNKIFWFTPAVCVFTGILLLSTVLSIPIQIEGVGYTDKISHSFAYFVLTLSFLLPLYKFNLIDTRNWFLLMIGCSLYGVLLEFVQYSLFPNRYFEWLDALSNVSGVLLASLLFKLTSKYVKKA